MYKGKVMSKRDILGEGMLSVCPTGSDCDDPTSMISVKDTSFYQGGPHAGAVFIPEYGTEITYGKCENDLEGEWYMIACVMKPNRDKVQVGNPMPSDQNPELGAPNLYPHDPDDGKYNSQSMSYGITSPLGHHMLMVEGRNNKSDIKGIRIETAEDRGITLDDSSKAKRVNVHSAFQNSYLVLTDSRCSDMEGKFLGPESANLHAKRNVELESDQGQMKISVKDGKNLIISNSSTQSHAPMLLTNPDDQFFGKSGSVIIEADRGDISITNHGNGVFIDCLGAQQENGSTGASFQVRSANKIHLYSENGIDIKSAGDINMVGANVNIKAFDYTTQTPGNINLNSSINDPNDSIAIRKTNAEIDAEKGLQPPLRFFDSGNGWDANYKIGYNTDPNL